MEILSRDDDATVYRLTGDSGEILMTSYHVFPEIELIYNDVHAQYCDESMTPSGNILEINHCLEGRIEVGYENEYFYLEAGDLAIARRIVHHARMVEATDNSPEMIEQAKRDCNSSKLHFSVQDMFSLPYADESFSIIIAANVLHVIPNPEKALDEIRRVLTADGLLIVPTFTHGDSGFFAKWKARIMRHIGFSLQHRW